ncbi:oligomeric complex COG6 [Russula ochroleuca]|uniref:Conserved oligomeric Golgi complex subunit 6 n=1 Tax=Russula ochroleuca TaxID=152965 RepID=A0A9P5JYD2_9AGAM|nr:oligomeric complex COG6 [Russula ochroleuca]
MPSLPSAAAVTEIGRRSQTASPSPLARNPVSLRLYKVLGATFEDEATKEALSTLSYLYSLSESSAVISAAKEDVVAPDGIDEVDMDSVKDVPSFLRGAPPGDTAAKARKHLRRDIESKMEEGSLRFLAAFGVVDQKLDVLQTHISTMRAQCEEAQVQLQSTNEACKSLLDRAGSLRDEQQQVKTRQSIITLFLARFTLSADEADALSSPEVPVGPTFFAAVDRAQAIRDDCRVLMAGENSPSRAGLDIMAVTSTHLEKAYDKLLRWCSVEFRGMGRDASLEVPDELSEAVRRLRSRPELLSDALTVLAQTRQTTLLSSFTSALTTGNRTGGIGARRPIDLHAHDALRYIGDMLAWVHQAIAAEREFLEALLSIDTGSRMPGAVRAPAHAEDEWLGELMDAAVAGLCGPLRARVLQTVRAQESGLYAYKVSRLLHFYALTMARTLGSRALLATTLKETTAASYTVFFDAIAAQGRALSRISLDQADTSVTPPQALLAHAQDLRAILALHTAEAEGDGNGDGEVASAEDSATIERALDALVDPAVRMCVAAAGEKDAALRRHVTSAPSPVTTTATAGTGVGGVWDRPVFVLNCLTYLVDTLAPYPCAARKHAELDGAVEARVLELIEEHYEMVLRDSGLHDAIRACEETPEDEPLAHVPACDPSTLRSTLASFAHWLTSLDAVHAPRLAALTAPALHARVHRAAQRRLGHVYAALCARVREPRSRYEAAATLLGAERPFGSVTTLWHILGINEVDGGDGPDV